MDPATTLIVIVLLVALTLLLSFILFELRAQARDREEFEKAILMALFRISKQSMEKHKTLAAVLLRSLRRAGVAERADATIAVSDAVGPAMLPESDAESTSDESSDEAISEVQRKV